MKFELDTYNRNSSDQDLIDDLIRVASLLKKKTLTISEYSKVGKFHSTTYRNRFGSWIKALEKAGLNTKRKNQELSEEEIIEDIKSVAKKLNKNTLTRFEYDNYGKYSSSGIAAKYGGWLNTLEKAGLNPSRKYGLTEEEYFENLEKVWVKLGRQPKYSEMQKPLSQLSAGAYERKFGNWRKALEEFVNFINSDETKEQTNEIITEHKTDVSLNEEVGITHKTKRNINHRLRFVVMRRDNFKCVICGKSPATDPSITLHVDHIKAWANGGKTVLENLQTLCSVCNIGKSDLEMKEN